MCLRGSRTSDSGLAHGISGDAYDFRTKFQSRGEIGSLDPNPRSCRLQCRVTPRCLQSPFQEIRLRWPTQSLLPLLEQGSAGQLEPLTHSLLKDVVEEAENPE